MNFPSKLAMTLLLLALSAPVSADPFVNLNFEQATVPPGTGDFISASLAFPGWTPRIRANIQTIVNYDTIGLGGASVALYDKGESGIGIPLLEGRYEGVLATSIGENYIASLSQTGDIPAGTKTIRFLAPDFVGPPVVTIDNVTIPLIRMSTGSPFSDIASYGGDISAFAGLTAELRFASGVGPSGFITAVDFVSFSPIAIPEPSALALVMAAMVWRNLRRRG